MKQVRQQLSTSSSKSAYSFSNSSSKSYGLVRSNSGLFGAPSTTPSTTPKWAVSAANRGLRKSASTTEVIETGRGFLPSDRQDPQKREFLTDLTKRVFKVGMVSAEGVGMGMGG